jgi:hypothetical protein
MNTLQRVPTSCFELSSGYPSAELSSEALLRSASAQMEDDQDDDDHEQAAQEAELHEAPAFRASATQRRALKAGPIGGWTTMFSTASLPPQRVSFKSIYDSYEGRSAEGSSPERVRAGRDGLEITRTRHL